MLWSCPHCGTLSNQAHCPRHQPRYRNGSTRAWRTLRLKILMRDGWTCRYCGQPAHTVDHITPLTYGGTDDPSNLVAACGKCNYGKGKL